MAIKMDNSQLIASELIKKSFEESLLDRQEDIKSNSSKFNKLLHDYFETFSASLILKAFDLSDEELEKGIVGNGNDGGCDGLYLFVNEELIYDDTPLENIKRNPKLDLYIIQSKFETSFREDVFNKWKSIVDNLFKIEAFKDNDFSNRYNSDVLEFFERFHNTFLSLITKSPIVSFKFIYVSLGNEVHPNVKQQATELMSKLKTLFPSPNTDVDVEYINAERILKLYDAPSKTDFVLHISETPIIVQEEKEYIVLADLNQYFKFITNENDKLIKHMFEANVRDYQGNITVNKEIAATLEQIDYKEDFWWLNNGITMLASKIDQKSTKVFEIKNPEIVNGLQTSTEIYNYLISTKKENKNESRKVLLRIIVPDTDASRDNIILATNSQTTIPKAILRGTDGIHREIENYMKTKGLFYDRRKNFYKNEGKPKDKIISIPFLAQCLISILLRKPNYARARPSTLLNDEETYKQLYLNNRILDSYYNAAVIGKRVRSFINNLGVYSISEQSDISFYVMYVCSAKISGSADISPKQLGNFNLDDITEEKVKLCAEYVYEKYQKLGGNNKVAKGTNLIDKLVDDEFIVKPFN
ncbi:MULTISPECIES: AIPR family protein [Bacillus]|uniref:AIPR family protein n=1 Tax=Bacillus TaxID=1386 RepID=UPI0027BAA20D|nr:AIPR family protein [Bacillus safensis]MED0864680.1 AIPR family protein [Bacillus safensis]MED1458785.1 AIPR family protein [Bacillus safensis]WLW69528.1 AIPR family protein [Bacillus safensis]